MRTALSPDVISWSALAEPTGEDDADAVVSEVERVSLSLWSAIASTRREEGESETAWRERRRQAYRELAPLLDRVGRLSVDVASLLQFEASGGEIERVAVARREREVPQRAFPPAPIAPLRARVGMDALVRGTAEGPWSLLPLDSVQDRTVVIRANDGERPMRESMVEFLSQLFSSVQRDGDVPNGDAAANAGNEEMAETEGVENSRHILSRSVNREESRPPSLL